VEATRVPPYTRFDNPRRSSRPGKVRDGMLGGERDEMKEWGSEEKLGGAACVKWQGERGASVRDFCVGRGRRAGGKMEIQKWESKGLWKR